MDSNGPARVAPIELAPQREWEPFSVADLLEEAASFAESRGDTDEVSLSTIVSATVPSVVVSHPERMRQILCTLLGNALRHSPPGTEVVASTAAHVAGLSRAVVSFEISDNAGGIPREVEERLFDSPAHPRSSIPYDEPELDLPAVKRLVADLDGEIGCANNPGLGCTFSFTVPVDLEDA